MRILVASFFVAFGLVACGTEDASVIGEACGEGTARDNDCGVGFCTLGECDLSAGTQYARSTCSAFCEADADCQAQDPGATCHPVSKHCHLPCTADAECPAQTRCGDDGTCVRADAPAFECAGD